VVDTSCPDDETNRSPGIPGTLSPILSGGGIDLEIDEEYVSAVRAANLEISDDALPEDPYPG
jgi:hypothetical protein